MSKFWRRGRVIGAWLYFGTLAVSGVLSFNNPGSFGEALPAPVVIFLGTLLSPMVGLFILLAIGAVLQFIEWSVQQWN